MRDKVGNDKIGVGRSFLRGGWHGMESKMTIFPKGIASSGKEEGSKHESKGSNFTSNISRLNS